MYMICGGRSKVKDLQVRLGSAQDSNYVGL